MKSKLYYDLLETIKKQDEMIYKQNKLMAKLVNENLEKENTINELMKQELEDNGLGFLAVEESKGEYKTSLFLILNIV